ncbi:uncharacterized protein LOC111713294 [Eurytemora carolleeae]|uniref:uncharacterized protein LOC111713294 n=1 Tax=Eurytemora carolleeae TaxID=1294199 RepID=UPI000C76C196|nr:uncharacterized protein LOC111713294 [Eurytemora carolleeae]|eukprot:XP_023343898.1 uncharacterized protein LOC111713294 [Eurytemora affinis]
MKFLVLVLSLEALGVLGILRGRRQTERSILRQRRNICNVGELFQTNFDGDALNIDVAKSFIDYYANMGGFAGIPKMCSDDGSDLQERENLIYVINSKNSRRRRRETSSHTKENLTQKEGNVLRKRVANSDDFPQTQISETLRNIERLAVKGDEIEAKITAAAAVLGNPEIQNDTEQFLIYRQRMKSLLRAKIEFLIQEHTETMKEYRKFEIPQQFHR